MPGLLYEPKPWTGALAQGITEGLRTGAAFQELAMQKQLIGLKKDALKYEKTTAE